jgi:hypothetical protein
MCVNFGYEISYNLTFKKCLNSLKEQCKNYLIETLLNIILLILFVLNKILKKQILKRKLIALSRNQLSSKRKKPKKTNRNKKLLTHTVFPSTQETK